MDAIGRLLTKHDLISTIFHKVMERLDWVNYLRAIHNRLLSESDVQPIYLDQFLTLLLQTAEDLPL